jgi:hypothetical protein
MRPIVDFKYGHKARVRLLAWLLVGGLAMAWLAGAPSAAAARLQEPAAPTVTPLTTGPTVLAVSQVNVRSGPAVGYELIGILVSGQRAEALGRSPGGDWIQIVYPGVPGNVGWVYAYNVTLDTGPSTLRVVEPQPTPTVRATATIDPTLAAQFPSLGMPAATRLPTFTAPPPVLQPTFPAYGSSSRGSGFPAMLAILGLLVVGTFGTLISFLRQR